MSSGAGEAGTATEPTAPEAETEAEDEVDAQEKGDVTEGEEKEEEGGGGILGRTVGAILGVGAAREAGEHGNQEQEEEREERADEEPEEQEIEAGEEEGPEAVGEPEEKEDEAADEPVDDAPGCGRRRSHRPQPRHLRGAPRRRLLRHAGDAGDHLPRAPGWLQVTR